LILKNYGEEINLVRKKAYQFFEFINVIVWLLNQSGSFGGSTLFEDRNCCRCYNSL